MSIKRLLKAIDSPNMVEKVMKREKGDITLMKIGNMVCKNHDANMESMEEWSDMLESGMDIAKFDNKSTSYPWDGAANFKSPLIMEAVRSFGDKAKTEVMKQRDLVTTGLVGIEDDIKKYAAERIEKHMNWQINSEMKTWREEQTRLFYMLAAQGSVFKKTYFDATEGCNRSDIVRYPNFSINQECDNLLESRFTEIKMHRHNDVWERQKTGLWYEYEDPILPVGDDLDDDVFEFIEQYCNYDLDGDGYEEPYLITVHKSTKKVVRIVPRWDIEGIHVEYNGNTYNLADLTQAATLPKTQDQEFNAIAADQAMADIESGSTLVRIVPMDILTYYGFLESTDGSYLSIGYLHALGSTVKGINKATNSLFNAGDLANLQGGWLSKEHRDKKNGPFRTKPGLFKQTNIGAAQLASSVQPLPFKEPSATLLTLTEQLKGEVKAMTSQFNFDEMLSPNIPAASVLGALQEGTIPTSSLLMNVVNAMSREFRILFTLNQKFTDPMMYKRIAGTDRFSDDYNMDIEICPTANAEFSNQMQRIQLAQAQMERLDVLLQVGGNPVPIIKAYYEALGTQNMEEIFPEQMSDADAKAQQQMMQLQQQQAELQQVQTQLLQAQVEQGNKELERKFAETMANMEEQRKESLRKDEETKARVTKMYADAMLAKERAETEDEKNRAELQLNAIKLMIGLMGQEAS